MARKRPKGVLELGWACFESAAAKRTEHLPVNLIYPEDVVKRVAFQSGGGLNWRISALTTPRETPAPWKIVVVTGAPSWAEYWADALAALPEDREMIVVDRPGFAGSEPVEYVGDIRLQAVALSPLLDAAPGQRVLLVGQSYGAAIAAIMAAQTRRRLHGLVLLSGFFGEAGPTARWLVDLGSKVLPFIPRDLRNAIREVSEQKNQLDHLRGALTQLRIPIHLVHGEKDDFAPIETAERLIAETPVRAPIRFRRVPDANHFLNDGPTEALMAILEECIPTEIARQKVGLATWLKALRLPWSRPAPLLQAAE